MKYSERPLPQLPPKPGVSQAERNTDACPLPSSPLPASPLPASPPAITQELLAKLQRRRNMFEADAQLEAEDRTAVVLPSQRSDTLLTQDLNISDAHPSPGETSREFPGFRRQESESRAIEVRRRSSASSGGTSCPLSQETSAPVSHALNSGGLRINIVNKPAHGDTNILRAAEGTTRAELRPQFYLNRGSDSQSSEPMQRPQAPQNQASQNRSIGDFSVSEIVTMAKDLGLGENTLSKLQNEKIDGSLLVDLVKEGILTSTLQFEKLEVLKITKAVREGWRPKHS